MGTTAEKLTYLNDTKGLLKNNINLTGAGLTNQTPFRQYATDLKTALLNILNNGIDTLYNNFPKTTGRGTNITLNNTLQAPIRSVINGDTEQNSYSGKNLLNLNNYIKGYFETTGTITYGGPNRNCIFYFKCEPNTKYTFKTQAQNVAQIIIANTNEVPAYGVNISNATTLSLSTLASRGFTYTTSSTSQYIVIRLQIATNYSYDYTTPNFTDFINNPQVELGQTATSYEPYVGGTASPSPDYPQEIKSVTGLQNITVCGKNLFDYTQLPIKKISATETIIDNGIKVTDTAIGSSHSVIYKMFDVSNLVGTTFTIKANWVASGSNLGRISIGLCDENGDNRIQGAYNDTSNNSLSYTIPTITTSKYLAIWLYSNTNGTSVTNTAYVDYTNIQLEKGSTATEYEAYQSQTKELNLGKNLIRYPYNVESGNYNGVQVTINNDGSITFNGTANSDGYLNIINISNKIYLQAGTYTMSIKNAGIEFSVRDSSGVLGYISGSQTSVTFTINEAKDVSFFFPIRNGTTYNLTVFPMLEKGSQATSYSPYFTPIHLYENDQIIGTPYNWSIDYNKHLFILDENTGINVESTADTPTLRTVFRFSLDKIPKTNQYLSNYFIYNSSTSNRIVLIANQQRPYISLDNEILGISTSDSNTEKINKLKTWLSSNNVLVVYEPVEPTTEPITNTELIEDLNNFYNKAKSYNGQTNISVEGDLQMILDVSAIIDE